MFKPFAAILALCLAPPAGAASRPDPVRAVYLAGIEAFNAHDLPRFLDQFAPDIAMYTPTGWVRGEGIRARYVETFARFPQVRMEVEDLTTQAVGRDTVTVAFRWRVYPRGTGPAFHGVGSGVYVKRHDRWLEVLEHETVTRVDPGAAPVPPSGR